MSSKAKGCPLFGMNYRKRLLWMAILILILLAAIVIAGDCIPSELYAENFRIKKQAPSLEHLFGTDAAGRDMLFRSLKGLSTSVKIGLASAIVSAVLALALGLAAALLGGFADSLITWLVDLCMSIPHLVLMIMISMLVGKGAKGVALAVALTHWPGITRIVRAEVKQISTATFIRTAEKLGQSRLRIALFHIFPHVFPQFIVGLVLMFPHAIMHEASITFLGFGLSMDSPAIGVILSESMKYLTVGLWWLAVLPGSMLIAVVILFNILGKNIEVLLNPYTGQK